ncbi:MAG: sulfate adenylyltransferase subunit CysN [Planctomycetes bacterium]|nr:sulfate adenylyltransferase subunit CysN [Planctomycetota bacterium]
MQHDQELDRVGIEQWLENYQHKELLRILTCGSVDDGKSTVIGRLLHDGAGVFEDQLKALVKDSTRFGTTGEEIDFALLMDGLQAEREQGITIDVAYRYFSTPKRKFIVADTPGHEQYTRNMATGASTSDLAIILIDARKGVLPQTRRHAFICSLLRIRHVVIAVNKMDLVDYDERVFESIRADCVDFMAKLAFGELHFIPMCARRGENIVFGCERMPWYKGGPLLDYLENVHIASDRNLVDLRLPVQLVLRPNLDFRGFAGTIASGVVRVGDELVALPSGKKSRVKTLASGGTPVEEAFAPMAVTLTLEDEIDVSRGDLFVRPNNAPELENTLEAMIVWMNETALEPGRSYLLKQTTQTVPAVVTDVRYRMSVETLRSEPAQKLGLNEIGRIRIECARAIPTDAYSQNRQTGAFILVDRLNNATLGAGMLLESTTAKDSLERGRRAHDAGTNLSPGQSGVAAERRAQRMAQTPFTLWFTGLPHSGKSSLAYALEVELFARGLHALVLDGESLRQGLCSDLGFSPADRAEHLRRAAQLVKLFQHQGLITLCTFVSPTLEQRSRTRAAVGGERFLEIFCDAPLAVCESRDTNKLFARARAGEIANVTGIDQPYEAPLKPDLKLDTAKIDVTTNVNAILDELEKRGWTPRT